MWYLCSPHLFLEDVQDDVADLLEARRVLENLLLAGFNDIVHGFQDAHHDLALVLRPNRFQEAGQHHF